MSQPHLRKRGREKGRIAVTPLKHYECKRTNFFGLGNQNRLGNHVTPFILKNKTVLLPPDTIASSFMLLLWEQSCSAAALRSLFSAPQRRLLSPPLLIASPWTVFQDKFNNNIIVCTFDGFDAILMLNICSADPKAARVVDNSHRIYKLLLQKLLKLLLPL